MGTKRGQPAKFLDQALLSDRDECLIWPFARSSQDGRARIYLADGSLDDKGRLIFRERAVHRIVCERMYGLPPTPDHEAAHSCGKGHEGCINPKHLRWATAEENEADKKIHGTVACGERNGFAKLNADQIQQIRALEGTISRKSLAEHFDVDARHVWNIQKKKVWRWLE